MPSRRAVALIVVLWVAVTGYVAYRDVWPVLFAAGPPPVAIDLADEAAQNVPTRWTITWNGKPAGKLTTSLKYLDADDTFRFTNEFRNVRVELLGATVVVPELRNVTRITRAGDLREQSADGKLELLLNNAPIASATAKVAGTVENGQLVAACEITSPFGNVSKALDPVPVPRGQPLNPLQPVNRVTNVRPGRRWVVSESDPLGEAVAAFVRAQAAQYGLKVPEEKREPLLAEVLTDPQTIDWRGHESPCCVIEYRRGPDVAARTHLRTADGKVLRQEAFNKGETLRIERDE
ncbi:unnamed protein product [Gemmataceae bacterium]|nr:unnamed protein product [Gemmataceae bacterium]VTU02125.1 unnamed protein product [Gemmataceae bacterium]